MPASFHSGLRALDEEFSYRADCVEGAVPPWLRGTFFRNGPGRLEVGGQRFGHWFDGDGMVCKFSFADGVVHFANRYVRTPRYVRETALNRIDFRGFGTQRPGGFLANVFRQPANPANTGVIWHANRLLALNEGGHPFALDPVSLDTVGEYDFAGALPAHAMFSAHGKVHPRTGHYINFGMGVVGLNRHGIRMALMVYRISASGVLEKTAAIPVDGFPFCHDFALTDRHAIFALNSIGMRNPGKVICGLASLADVIAFDQHQPMRFLVVDLETLQVVLQTQAAPGAVIHFGNAWESEAAFHADAMFTDNFDVNDKLRDIWHADKLGGGRFLRYTIDRQSGAISTEQVCELECEFPQWDTRLNGVRHPATYVASVTPGSDSFFNALARITTGMGTPDVMKLPEGCFASEPMFVPDPASPDNQGGVLLDVVYNANTQRSELWIMDAARLDRVLATIRLPHHIPHQFHGFFTSQLFA